MRKLNTHVRRGDLFRFLLAGVFLGIIFFTLTTVMTIPLAMLTTAALGGYVVVAIERHDRM